MVLVRVLNFWITSVFCLFQSESEVCLNFSQKCTHQENLKYFFQQIPTFGTICLNSYLKSLSLLQHGTSFLQRSLSAMSTVRLIIVQSLQHVTMVFIHIFFLIAIPILLHVQTCHLHSYCFSHQKIQILSLALPPSSRSAWVSHFQKK